MFARCRWFCRTPALLTKLASEGPSGSDNGSGTFLFLLYLEIRGQGPDVLAAGAE